MKKFSNIRLLYAPLQPTIKHSVENVTYSEFSPDIRLQNYIYCYWELKSMQALSQPFTYRAVADGCIDIFFQLAQPKENFVMGFCEKFTEFPLFDTFHYIGIRFFPSMFPQFFKINVSELSNRFEELHNVAPKLSAYIGENFNPQMSTEHIQKTLDHYFVNLLSNTSFDNDIRLYNALQEILKMNGVINIQRDLDTGISHRQLRRLFEFYIGDSAKSFAKVVRFQNILRAKESSQIVDDKQMFLDAGYFDQSHYIKEFKNFYGATPGKVFNQ